MVRIHFIICVDSDDSSWFESPCYPGEKPFSEVEAVALSEFIKTIDNVKLHLSFHSSGNKLMFSYVSLFGRLD